jgi:CBS domain containing-hemolysin-like protein
LVYVLASLAEGALGALSRARVQRLAEVDPEAGRRIEDFAERPAVYLATASLIQLVALTASAVCLIQLLEGGHAGSVTFLGWIILVIGSLVLGWVLPRSIGSSWPEQVALTLDVPLHVLFWVFSPIAALLNALTNGLSRLLGAEEVPEGPLVTPAELRVMVAASEEEGLIEEQERTMIDNILEFESISVREVMVPRPDMTALPATTTVRQAIETFAQEGYSRLPVYDETIDHIVGVLYGKDLFRLVLDARVDAPIRELLRPAYFVPESKKTDDLLRELQQTRIHIAIVVDEYGGTSGLVTIEDLLEEIVGEIQDEHDVEERDKIIPSSPDEATVDASVSIDDVNDALGTDLRAEEVESIGGLIYEKLGRIPVVGDEVHEDHAVLTVTGAEGRRVTWVRVKKLPDELSNGTAAAKSAAEEE